MKKLAPTLLLVLSLLGEVSMTPAQTTASIIVSDHRMVSGDALTGPHVAHCIPADPADPKPLIATSIAFPRPDAWFTVSVFTSFDGGLPWHRGKLEGLTDF